MGELFPNQYYGIDKRKHRDLPIIDSHDFNFYRCLEFQDDFYGRTISELHRGNLRISRKDNRYSNLFPEQKLSYWADSPKTARSEIKKWGAGNNIMTFCGYDDGSSSYPTVYPNEYLRIIDGIHFGFDKILKKSNNQEELTANEKDFLDRIKAENPDCLAYNSEAEEGGVCFLFFECGFKKISLREVSLKLGNRKSKNSAKVICAHSSDYFPILEGYGYYFDRIARVKFDDEYIKSDEYNTRKQVEEYSYKYMMENYDE